VAELYFLAAPMVGSRVRGIGIGECRARESLLREKHNS
jgi:hypothetical protein